MMYLHESPLRFHGSLCTSNCLIDSRWVVKLSDFGLQAFKRGLEDVPDTLTMAAKCLSKSRIKCFLLLPIISLKNFSIVHPNCCDPAQPTLSQAPRRQIFTPSALFSTKFTLVTVLSVTLDSHRWSASKKCSSQMTSPIRLGRNH